MGGLLNLSQSLSLLSPHRLDGSWFENSWGILDMPCLLHFWSLFPPQLQSGPCDADPSIRSSRTSIRSSRWEPPTSSPIPAHGFAGPSTSHTATCSRCMSWTKEIHGGNRLPILIEAHVKGLALLAPCVAVVEHQGGNNRNQTVQS